MNTLLERKDGWIGGDGAYSVSLSTNRTLWLFSDTWVGAVKDGKRTGATIVNNSVGLMDGQGSKATMQFVVREDKNRKPIALIVPASGKGWFWPLGSVLAHDRLYVTLAQIEKNGEPGAFGFRAVGRTLGVVSNPHDSPAAWRLEQKPMPCAIFEENRELSFGAAMLLVGDVVYIYGTDESRHPTGPERSLLVARAPADKIADFDSWRFYGDEQWTADYRQASHLVGDMASECSVSYLAGRKQYVLVYTERGLSPKILARTAANPWGPWSKASTIYECPEAAWDKQVFCYAAKAHASLSTDDELVVSYVASSFDFWQVAKDARLYWPRFVRVKIETM